MSGRSAKPGRRSGRANRVMRPIGLDILEDRLLLAVSISVNGAIDTVGRDGVVTLREAILISNRDLSVSDLDPDERLRLTTLTNPSEPDRISFDLPAAAMRVIRPTSALPTSTRPVVIDGFVREGSKEFRTELDGSQAGPFVDGLTIVGGGSTVSGLVINRFGGNGILLQDEGKDHIEGNYIGTDAEGLVAEANGFSGVFINGSSGNTIGGKTPEARNLVSGNGLNGIDLAPQRSGLASDENVIFGNIVGLDINEMNTNLVGNTISGVVLDRAGNNVVEANVVAGNLIYGINLDGERASHNLIRGNWVGTNHAGTNDLGNFNDGITIAKASDNTIGGTTPDARNIISGNLGHGVRLVGQDPNIPGGPSARNSLLGNYIGTDPTGMRDLGNTLDGVLLEDSPGNTIGGTAPGAGNLISGNRHGVYIHTLRQHGSPADGNVVQGNLIGTDKDGALPLFNIEEGILIVMASKTLIGGEADGARNVISGNFTDGVSIIGPSDADRKAHEFPIFEATGNLVQNNIIGADLHGTTAIGNRQAGVAMVDAVGNTVGGVGPRTGNLIAGNGGAGVRISGRYSAGNLVLGNTIGTDLAGMQALANGADGVLIDDGASANTIGGTAARAGNLVSGNRGSGVALVGRATGNLIVGNDLGLDASGTGPLGNGLAGVLIAEAAFGNTIGGTAVGGGNTIARNSIGVFLLGAGTTGNQILGNRVGTNAEGTSLNAPDGRSLGNTAYGLLLLDGASGNILGGTSPGAGNVVSGNGLGVAIMGIGTRFNVLLGNRIGTDAAGANPLGNLQAGILVNNAPDNRIGGTAPGAGNLISGNQGDGVHLFGPGAKRTLVVGNRIGTDLTGRRAEGVDGRSLGNTRDGLLIEDASENTVGGPTPAAINILSNNGAAGVAIRGGTASGNLVRGNRIGTDATGIVAIGNALDGVLLNDAPRNVIGGAGPEGNLISGNLGSGIQLVGLRATGNLVLGNRIGTDGGGSGAVGNALAGVFVNGAPGNLIAGLNLISGNVEDGVRIVGARSAGTAILGNTIGVDLAGRAALGNGRDGVRIEQASNVRVGGPGEGLRNLIAGNAGSGVTIVGAGATGNLVVGNRIGTDAAGRVALGNPVGVSLESTSENLVGGTDAGAGNVISGNRVGVQITGPSATANRVQGNRIGTDESGLAALGNVMGVVIDQAPGNEIGGESPGSGNLISGNESAGVYLSGLGATGNRVQGNVIGSDRDGARPLAGPAPQGIGVIVNEAPGNLVGGGTAASANVISGNVVGVYIAGFAASGNLVQGNVIGADRSGTIAVANTVGVYINGSPSNTIGGTTAGARNVISGNVQTGVLLLGVRAKANVVQGNFIGLDATGTRAIPNLTGVYLENAPGNVIGGGSPSARNYIVSAGKGSVGVYIFDTGSVGNVAKGNFIGSDLTGRRTLGRADYGILLYNASKNVTDQRSGPTARILGTRISNVREFTGAIPRNDPRRSGSSKS